MTNAEILDKINELETEIANLRAELEKPDTPWVPEIGDTYQRITAAGSVMQVGWDNDVVDAAHLSIGNVFRSKADAEFMVERLKVIAELRRLAKGFVPDWGDKNQKKWLLAYDGDGDENGRADFCIAVNFGAPVYFQSQEDAQAAIEAVGAERLKKFYFMVGGD